MAPNDPPNIAAARAKTDLNADGSVNATDFHQFIDLAFSVMNYDASQATPTIPLSPTSLLASVSGTVVTLNWTDNSNNELGFTVERQGSTTLLGTNANVTTLTDQPGPGTWNYRVRSFNNVGVSAWTTYTPITVASVPTNPLAPSGFAINVSGQVITLNWADNSTDETSFQIEKNGSANYITAAMNATSYSESPGAGTWSYRIRATNANGSSAWVGPVSATVVVSTPPVGWTNLALPVGAMAFYVSSSTGNDSNTGTISAPLKTIAAGYAKLRNGQPDQLLLKCGDTWNESINVSKSSNSATTYLVVGSYGTGSRPKLRTSGSAVRGGGTAIKGAAFVSLDMQPTSYQTQTEPGFGLLPNTATPMSNVLIEDCDIRGYAVGIVGQHLTDGQTFDGLKIRRCIIVDNDNTASTGHSQGVFLGGAANWLIEECIIDNNARSKNDMFCHNLYCHEYSAPGTFKGNISSRACSHGGQQRPGGIAENNLFLQNPINFYQGGNSLITGNTVNIFRYNVAIDSRDINGTDKRGFGYVLGGAGGSVVEYNIAAFQVKGTSAIDGFDFDGWHGSSVKGNVCWDWDGPNAGNPGWCTAYHFENGCSVGSFANNTAVHHLNGMCVRWESPWNGTYVGNTYWTATPDGGVGGYLRFATSGGVGATWNTWKTSTGDTGTFLSTAPAQKAGNIGDYLTFLGISPGSDPLVTFLNLARANSKQNWDVRFTASAFNSWARGIFGITSNPA